jgi:hypothetical protein
MLGFFKKREPDSLTSKSVYYERECVVNTVTDLFLLLSDIKDFEYRNTNVPITISNIPLNGINTKQVKKILDTPKYIFNNNDNIEGHSVLFYKEEADIYRFLIQFHFINDNLFFVANKIYTGMSLSHNNKVLIVKQLAKKYLNLDDFDVPGDYGIFIRDNNNNKLFTRDGVYFFVNYITGDNVIDELYEKYTFVGNEIKKNKDDTFNKSLDKFL